MKKPQKPKPRYIDLDLEDALSQKWIEGAKEHRKPGQIGFQGDPFEELYQELLDSINLTAVVEQKGAELPGFHTTFRNMALTLQAREKELRRRA
jgi:hypothetical protein